MVAPEQGRPALGSIMRRIDILLTGGIEGGTVPFAHGDLEIRFHRLLDGGELPLLEGAVWAFLPVADAGEGEAAAASDFEICRRLRCHPRTAQARIVVMLERDDGDARRQALRAGVDDIMIGPVTRSILLDRVLAEHTERPEDDVQCVIQHGKLSMDIAAFQARWDNRPVSLMPNEFRLLRFFVEHPGRIYTRQQLIAALGKQEPPIDERTVDVWIGRLRRALRGVGAPDMLRTVRSLGYILDKP